MNRDDEVEAGQNRGEAGDEDAQSGRDHLRRRRHGAEWSVESPSRVDAARDERVQREQPPEHVNVPAREIQFRKREVFGADHERHEEIPEHGRNDGDEEEKHHHHAVHREQLVVGLVRHQIAGRRRELEAQQHGEDAADEEEERDGGEVQQGDPLVIAREQPRADAVSVVQIVPRRR